MAGTPVFAGTRVPVQTLLDYLEGGESIDSFLDGFPTVTKEQVLAFLREVKPEYLVALITERIAAMNLPIDDCEVMKKEIVAGRK
jgi:uncharacterized protein (DUF433 family)